MASRSKVTDPQLMRIFTDVQETMNERYSDTYRRVWVQYCRIGKERIHVMFTLFPTVGSYDTVSFRDISVTTLSVDSLIGLMVE
jgi:hypothetical protein